MANKHDQAGALLLTWTIEILKNKMTKIKINELIKIKIGFLLWTGSLITVTFFLFIYLSNAPPLVTI